MCRVKDIRGMSPKLGEVDLCGSRLNGLRKNALTPFVISIVARNLSSIQSREKKERFLASHGMTKQNAFSAACPGATSPGCKTDL
jgi:hypothetical protein